MIVKAWLMFNDNEDATITSNNFQTRVHNWVQINILI